MYITGGGNIKGNVVPNQQNDSSSLSLTEQQPQQQQQQQQQQQTGTVSFMQSLSMPPTFHPAYLPQTPSPHVYTLIPQFRFSALQIPPNILNYSPYTYTNPILPSQNRASVTPGFTAITNNANVPLQTNIVSIIKAPPAITTSASGSKVRAIKKRKHALPIINPITRKNVLEEISGETENDDTTKSVINENTNESEKQSESNTLSILSTVSNRNTLLNVKNTKSDKISEEIKKSNVENIPEKNLENEPESQNSLLHIKDEEFIEKGTYKSENNIATIQKEEIQCEKQKVEKQVQTQRYFDDISIITDNTKSKEEQQVPVTDTNNFKTPTNHTEGNLVDVDKLSSPNTSLNNLKAKYSESSSSSSQFNNEKQQLEQNLNGARTETEQRIMEERNFVNDNSRNNRKRTNLGKRKKRNYEYYGQDSKYKTVKENFSKNDDDYEPEKEKQVKVAENKEDNDGNKKKDSVCKGTSMITPTMEFTHPSKVNEFENNWKGFIQNEMKLSPDKSLIKHSVNNVSSIKRHEDENNQKQSNDNNDTSKKTMNIEEILKKIDSKTSHYLKLIQYKSWQWSPTNTNGKRVYEIHQMKLMCNLPAAKMKPKLNSKTCSVVLPNMRQTQKSLQSTIRLNSTNTNSLNDRNTNVNNHDGWTKNKVRDDNCNNSNGNNNVHNKQYHPNHNYHHHYQHQQQQHKRFYKGSSSCSSNISSSNKDGGNNNITSGNSNNMNSGGDGHKSNQNKSNRNDTSLMHLSLGLNKDIKLNESENAWRPSHLKLDNDISEPSANREHDDILRKVRGILNKLTPEKFDTLMEQILQLPINTTEKVNAVMMLVFEKAIDEPNFSASYALLCQRLADKNLQSEKDATTQNNTNNIDDGNDSCIKKSSFKTALLNKTEKEFNMNVIDVQSKKLKLKPIIEQINNCTDNKKKMELKSILEEEEFKFRRRSCGTVRFIGELFKISMLTGKIIKRCILNLLDAKYEDKLECLCKLLTTVGQKYENTLNKETGTNFSLNDVIRNMQMIIDRKEEGSEKISNRVRFMLQDVIDLRKNNWNVNHLKLNTLKIDNVSTRNEQQQQQQCHHPQQHNNYHHQRRNDSTIKGEQHKLKSSYSKKSGDKQQSNMNQQQQQNKYRKMQQNKSQNEQNQQHRQYNDEIGRDEGEGKEETGGTSSSTSWFKQTSMQPGTNQQQQQQRFVDTSKLNSIFNIDNKMKFGDSSLFIWKRGDNNTVNNNNNGNSNNIMPTKNFQDSNKNKQNQQYQKQSSIRPTSSFSYSSYKNCCENMNLRRNVENSLNLFDKNLSNIAKGNGVDLNKSSVCHGINKNVISIPIKKIKPDTICNDNINNNSNYKNNINVYYETSSNDNLASTSITVKTAASLSSSSESVAAIDDNNGIIGIENDYDNNDTINYNRIINDLIEISINEKFNDSLEIWNELPQKSHSKLFYIIFSDTLNLGKIKKFHRRLLSNLIQYLIKNHKLKQTDIIKGYNEFCKYVADIIIDVPDVWQYVFEFIGPLIYKKKLLIKNLWNKQLLFDNMGKKFLKNFINYFLNEYNKNTIISIWKETNLKWSDYLLMNDNEINDFIIENNFEFLKDVLNEDNNKVITIKNNNTSNNGNDGAASIKTITKKNNQIENSCNSATNNSDTSENNNPSSSLDEKTLIKIKELLTNNNTTSDHIINYLNNIKIQNRLEFIRNIMKVICEYTFNYNKAKIQRNFLKFDEKKFRYKCIPLLYRLLDSNEEYELECLNSIKFYTIKNFNTRLSTTTVETNMEISNSAGSSNYNANNNNRNNIVDNLLTDLLRQIFYELWDSDIISRETFGKWFDLLKIDNKNQFQRQQQQENYRIVQNLKSFFDSIKN